MIYTIEDDMNEENVFICIKTVAKRYEVTEDCIRKWVASLKFPAPLKLNGASRWRVADLELWEATK